MNLIRLTCLLAAAVCVGGISVSAVQAADAEKLRIIDTNTEFVVHAREGVKGMTITRTMTACAKNKGWLQPLVPVDGVHPIGEIEMLEAMNDADALIVDMREPQDRANGTIPGSKHVVYTEVTTRLNELGCSKSADKWDCRQAKKVYAFCNGPVCPQSPTAIKAMTREGFPAEKIYYYRGGMLDWTALGFPVLVGDF